MNIYTVILNIISFFASTAWRWLFDKAERCSCWSQKYMVCSTVILIGFYKIINTKTKGCILQMCLCDLEYHVGFDNTYCRHVSITVQRHTKLVRKRGGKSSLWKLRFTQECNTKIELTLPARMRTNSKFLLTW